MASIAREHGVNANQVFYWRKRYRAGQLAASEQSNEVRFLPVSVAEDVPAFEAPDESASSDRSVTINIEIPGMTRKSGRHSPKPKEAVIDEEGEEDEDFEDNSEERYSIAMAEVNDEEA